MRLRLRSSIQFVRVRSESGCIARHNEARDTLDLSILPLRPRKDEAMRRSMHSGLPLLEAIQKPSIYAIPLLWPPLGFHVCSIRPMLWFRQPERYAHFAPQPSPNQFFFLLLVSIVHHHHHIGEVSHHGMLVLQVVEQAQALGCKMLAYHRHPQIAATAVLAATSSILFRKRESVEASFIGKLSRFVEQILPFLTREAAIVPVGSSVLAAMVEEAIIVVFLLKRNDLFVNEFVEVGKILL